MSKPTIVLPEAAEIARRLEALGDAQHVVEGMYPRIQAKAGLCLNGSGVAMVVTLAIADYAQGMPSVITTTLMMRAEQYVRALVDDPAVLADALAILAAAKR